MDRHAWSAEPSSIIPSLKRMPDFSFSVCFSCTILTVDEVTYDVSSFLEEPYVWDMPQENGLRAP